MPTLLIPLWGHMGGIDEVGIFAVPALLAIFALRWAERRARRRAAGDGSGTAAPPVVEKGAGGSGSSRLSSEPDE